MRCQRPGSVVTWRPDAIPGSASKCGCGYLMLSAARSGGGEPPAAARVPRRRTGCPARRRQQVRSAVTGACIMPGPRRRTGAPIRGGPEGQHQDRLAGRPEPLRPGPSHSRGERPGQRYARHRELARSRWPPPGPGRSRGRRVQRLRGTRSRRLTGLPLAAATADGSRRSSAGSGHLAPCRRQRRFAPSTGSPSCHS
jgi:hypothetical protein